MAGDKNSGQRIGVKGNCIMTSTKIQTQRKHKTTDCRAQSERPCADYPVRMNVHQSCGAATCKSPKQEKNQAEFGFRLSHVLSSRNCQKPTGNRNRSHVAHMLRSTASCDISPAMGSHNSHSAELCRSPSERCQETFIQGSNHNPRSVNTTANATR